LWGVAQHLQIPFQGKIYRVGFSTERNLKKIESLFSDRGVPTDYENVFDYYASEILYDGGTAYTDSWLLSLDGGDPYDFSVENAESHLATYTLLPKVELGKYILDIGVDSYWEDYLPLSYFGKYVADASNKKKFQFDFLQLNLDYPRFERFSGSNYDTTNSMIKTYVTFQYTASGAKHNILKLY